MAENNLDEIVKTVFCRKDGKPPRKDLKTDLFTLCL